jgi:cytochrome c6
VLRRIDSVLAVLSWVVAGLLVVMLFIGPQVIAEDKAESTGEAAGSAPYASGSGGSTNGKGIFTQSCGSCHTLDAAGTTGKVGPSLDGTSLGKADIEEIVRSGRGTMPGFEGRLSAAEISSVADFVAGSR